MASINQNTPPPTLPDFCNLGVTLRVILIVNGLGVLAGIARNPAWLGWWQEFLPIAAFIQPGLLASLLLLCGMRQLFADRHYREFVVAVFIVEILIGVAMFFGMHTLLPGDDFLSLAAVLAFVLVATGIVLFYLNLRGRALSPAITEARLQALQARIRPHFLFNSLTAVLSLMRADPRRAERVLEDLADLFRVLMGDNRQLVPLQSEFVLCRQYLDLEQLRLGERLKVAWHIDKMPDDALVPPLILQPLLENAVYHGIEPSAEPGEININIYRNRDHVYIVLRNPYRGDGGTHHQGNKMALNNIRERLALHFDVEASMKSQVVGSHYQVTIVIPYTKQTNG
jgi:two-component system, LytTR family, sensor histidine kinase AlgZ